VTYKREDISKREKISEERRHKGGKLRNSTDMKTRFAEEEQKTFEVTRDE
jgi:hypothetical protein